MLKYLILTYVNKNIYNKSIYYINVYHMLLLVHGVTITYKSYKKGQ